MTSISQDRLEFTDVNTKDSEEFKKNVCLPYFKDIYKVNNNS